jgi:hypothetical protein
MLSLQKPQPNGFGTRPQKVLMTMSKSIEDKLEESVVEIGKYNYTLLICFIFVLMSLLNLALGGSMQQIKKAFILTLGNELDGQFLEYVLKLVKHKREELRTTVARMRSKIELHPRNVPLKQQTAIGDVLVVGTMSREDLFLERDKLEQRLEIVSYHLLKTNELAFIDGVVEDLKKIKNYADTPPNTRRDFEGFEISQKRKLRSMSNPGVVAREVGVPANEQRSWYQFIFGGTITEEDIKDDKVIYFDA